MIRDITTGFWHYFVDKENFDKVLSDFCANPAGMGWQTEGWYKMLRYEYDGISYVELVSAEVLHKELKHSAILISNEILHIERCRLT